MLNKILVGREIPAVRKGANVALLQEESSSRRDFHETQPEKKGMLRNSIFHKSSPSNISTNRKIKYSVRNLQFMLHKTLKISHKNRELNKTLLRFLTALNTQDAWSKIE